MIATVLSACAREGGPDEGPELPAPEAEPGVRGSPPVSTQFSLQAGELDSMIAELPPSSRSAIEADPADFLDLVTRVLDLPFALTVLADKEHPLGADYEPAEIVPLDRFRDELSLSREGHRLAAVAVEPLRQMSRAAVADGIVLLVSSAYRSYDYQQQVYSRWVEELGQEQADRVSARPGTSQHQLGTAVDFGCICPAIAEQPAGSWLAENAHRFGFSLSYPDGAEAITGYSYEPWHFRYVGVAATELEQQYFSGMQQWMLEWLAEHRAALESRRRTS
mgnify:FL=1